jgi:hypothetical protein
MSTRATSVLALVILGSAHAAAAQQFQIGIIDFYGLHRVSQAEARRTLTFTEGDSLSLEGEAPPAFLSESERQLAALPNVVSARTNIVCCDQGRLIIYVGVEEEGGATLRFRAAPKGSVRLPADVVQAGEEFSDAFMAAVERGDAGEDDSQGHALYNDPATRAVQERFVGYAARDTQQLRRVLRESSDADQRALAAQVLGYVADKQGVVDDLVHGMSDPSENVRNNCMRALMVFTRMTPTAEKATPRIPQDPFIALLNSLVWTDRNKSSLALMELTDGRDPKLLSKLRNGAMQPLVDMARWKNEGHAMPGLLILGRIAGWSDEDVRAAWGSGQREKVIAAALASH